MTELSEDTPNTGPQPFLIPSGHTRLPDGRLMTSEEYDRRLTLLSKVFPADEVEKLPKQMSRNDDTKYGCKRGTNASADGYFCGGYHARSMHLDYIGHAGITDRLNQVDPQWTWKPMARTPAGTPLIENGGMWGYLTVLGVTRIGYGDAPGKNGGNAMKEIIGDFLRNAAMRFGVGTYLWGKSEAALAKKRGEEAHDDPPLQRDESTLTQQRPAENTGHPDDDRGQPAETPPQKLDWKALYQATGGDVDKLKALRHTAKNAGAPDNFWLFGAIEKDLNPEPIEGNIPA